MGAVEFFAVTIQAVAWPLAVVMAVLMQRKPLGRLIDRVRGGEVFGQKFDAPPSGLEDAAKAGVSSPGVEDVLHDLAEAVEPADRDPDAAKPMHSGEDPVPQTQAVDAAGQPGVLDGKEFERRTRELVHRLGSAQKQDEERRRAEVERIIRYAAGWGADMARLFPGGDPWEPVVKWDSDGSPEILVGRRLSHAERRNRERHLKSRLDAATALSARAEESRSKAAVAAGAAQRTLAAASTDEERAAAQRDLAQAEERAQRASMEAREALIARNDIEWELRALQRNLDGDT